MQSQLAQWRKQTGARMPTENPNYDPTRTGEWWSRRTNKPLDIETMRQRYETKRPNSGR
jgi:hypothetical protein